MAVVDVLNNIGAAATAALGAYALQQQSADVFTVAGVAWWGAAAGRVLSIIVSDTREPKNFGGVLFEGIIGALLLAR